MDIITAFSSVSLQWLVAFAIAMGFGGAAFAVHRRRVFAGGFWYLAVCALAARAALDAHGQGTAISTFAAEAVAPLLPGMLLAGACYFDKRRLPGWLLPSVVGVGFARGALALWGPAWSAGAAALAFDPLAAAAAGWIQRRTTRRIYPGLADWVLTPLLVLIAGLFVLEGIGSVSTPGARLPWAVWIAALVPAHVVILTAGLLRVMDKRQSIARALTSSERRLRAAQRIARMGSYEWDIRADVLHWSEEHYRLLGIDPLPETITNRRFMDLVHPDDRRTIVEAVAESLKTGSEVDVEYRVRRPGGEERILHGRGETTFDGAGRPLCHSGTSHDVTENRRSQQALRESEERQRALLTAFDLGRAVSVDRNGFVRSILGEPGRSGTYGVKGEDVPGRHIEDFLPGQQGHLIFDAVRRVYASGQSEEVEALVSFPNGPFHFDVSLRALKGDAGEVEQVLAIVRDVTKRKATELALRQSEERQRLIFDSLARTLVVLLDVEGRVLSVYGDQSEGAIYGMHRGEFIGPRGQRILPEADVVRVGELFREVADTGEPREFRQAALLPNGTFHYDVILSRMRSHDAEGPVILAVARDVTEIVEAQNRSHQMEEKLQRAQKLESLGVMAGGIAHDFNNLLVGILGNAEIAMETAPSGSLQEQRIEDIVRASERAADLTQQLLAYAGNAKFSLEPVDIAALVEETLQLLRSRIARDLNLEVIRPAGSLWVHGDATPIRQVVMNLITNACEACAGNGGGVRVTLAERHVNRDFLVGCYLQPELEEGVFVVIEVEDTGAGMAPDTLTRIFDPFFTTKFEGRGLGLASTLGIVRAHGGGVRAESALDRGTRFTVVLPSVAPRDTIALPASHPPAAGDETVLVVDDEASVRDVASRLLTARGFTPLVAASGAEAVEILREHGQEVSIALLDVSMPDLNGQRTLEALRALRPDLRVVFMSGHGPEEAARQLADFGGAAFLDKPFRLVELADAIRAALDAEPPPVE